MNATTVRINPPTIIIGGCRRNDDSIALHLIEVTQLIACFRMKTEIVAKSFVAIVAGSVALSSVALAVFVANTVHLRHCSTLIVGEVVNLVGTL